MQRENPAELMNVPLIKLLQDEGIQLARSRKKRWITRWTGSFKGSNLIVGVQVYAENPQVMTTEEKKVSCEKAST